MRIAIFQNSLDTIGGAEVVGLRMARELDADIYTTNIDREKIRSMGFGDVRIHSIGRVPINAPFRQQLTLWRFGHLKLTGYDFYIINGDWAVSAAKRHGPNLWYVNATIREIWDMYSYIRSNNLPLWQRPIFDVWVRFNRYLNCRHVACVDQIVSNSSFTQARVKKYLDRDSDVLYPPIDTKAFRNKGTGSYWLSVNRLIAYKRVDMQLDAFKLLPDHKLVILGPYEKSRHCLSYAQRIHRDAPDNITILDKADTFEALTDFYADCRGFITTCRQEDFGMTAIEALASGKPVIAPNEGGYRESIISGIHGILIDDINPSKIADAVRTIETHITSDPQMYDQVCRDRAAQFDVGRFMETIKKKIIV